MTPLLRTYKALAVAIADGDHFSLSGRTTF